MKRRVRCAIIPSNTDRLQVPHHSATSWASHWHNRHDIADKILRSFQGEENEDDEDEDEDEEDSGSESSPSEAVEEDSESEVIRQTTSSHRRTKPPPRVPNASNRISSVPSSPFEMYDPSATTDTDEADMGSSGSLFTPADWRILARYVARTPGWDDIVNRERWEGFLEIVSTVIFPVPADCDVACSFRITGDQKSRGESFTDGTKTVRSSLFLVVMFSDPHIVFHLHSHYGPLSPLQRYKVVEQYDEYKNATREAELGASAGTTRDGRRRKGVGRGWGL
jgi:hypothetical protein